MDDSWACSAAYVYALHLNPSGRAWEYLRRNPRYQRDWAHHRRGRSQRIAARWGLASLVDPRLDARQVSPVWCIGDVAPVTLVRYELTHAEPMLAGIGCFSLWGLRGRKSLVGDDGGIRLVVHSAAKAAQARVGWNLSEGDRFAYQVPAAADERPACAALTRLRELMPVFAGGRAGYPERPGRADLFHARALQALDGLAMGATQREVATALFGASAVARAWQPDSALGAQLRYLIRRARTLMEGEYCSLVDGGQAVSGAGNARAHPRNGAIDDAGESAMARYPRSTVELGGDGDDGLYGDPVCAPTSRT